MTTEERLKQIESKARVNGFTYNEEARWLVDRVRKLEKVREAASKHLSASSKLFVEKGRISSHKDQIKKELRQALADCEEP